MLQLTRRMVQRPEIAIVSGVEVRTFAGPGDIEPWLELRHRAFAHQSVGIRRWDVGDFEAEFLARSWWRAERMWLAEPVQREARGSLIGSVTLALRGEGPQAKPVVHWLVVLPEWRRRGLGRLLMSVLEASCWDAGQRQVWLETHAAWQPAVEFYRSLGYEPADEGG